MTVLPARRSNEISRSSYYALGGCLNSSLQKVSNGRLTTYHYVGVGQAYWKQDLPKGPTGD